MGSNDMDAPPHSGLMTPSQFGAVMPQSVGASMSLEPYSPLGRGFLTGAIRRPEDFAADDDRRTSLRVQGEHFARNLDQVAKVQTLAQHQGCTAARLALAWVLAQGKGIVPIPGTQRRRSLKKNGAAADVLLTPAEWTQIEAVFPPDAAAGPPYPEAMMRRVNA